MHPISHDAQAKAQDPYLHADQVYRDIISAKTFPEIQAAIDNAAQIDHDAKLRTFSQFYMADAGHWRQLWFEKTELFFLFLREQRALLAQNYISAIAYLRRLHSTKLMIHPILCASDRIWAGYQRPAAFTCDSGSRNHLRDLNSCPRILVP